MKQALNRGRPPVSPGSSAIAVASGVFIAFVAAGPDAGVRPLALPYLLLVPGVALVRAAGLRTSPASVSLAIALSVGVEGAAAFALIAVGWLNPVLVAILVVAVTLAGVFVDEGLGRGRTTPVGLEAGVPSPPDGAGTHRYYAS